MFDTECWSEVTVTARRDWNDRGLFTLTVDAAPPFDPGQFGRLGLVVDGEPVDRSYSIASAPGEPLDFFIVEVHDGALTPRLAALSPDDRVWLHHKVIGRFTAHRVPADPEGTLWLLGTGTGLAPYVAMLRHGAVFDRFAHVVVGQGVRHVDDLAYADELIALTAARPLTWVPLVSRDDPPHGGRFDAPRVCPLPGRITDRFVDGRLEQAVGRPITAEASQVMLCGNPKMVREMMGHLKGRGLGLHTPRRDGQIHLERYW